jgi:hypothetical protein
LLRSDVGGAVRLAPLHGGNDGAAVFRTGKCWGSEEPHCSCRQKSDLTTGNGHNINVVVRS